MEDDKKGRDMQSTPWKLDKTINLPMLFTVFMGIITAALWAGSMNQRVSNIETSVARVETTVNGMRTEINKVPVIDERATSTRRDLDRVIQEIARRNGIDL